MTQAFVGGDYGAAAAMAQRFRQLQQENERVRMRARRNRMPAAASGPGTVNGESPSSRPWTSGGGFDELADGAEESLFPRPVPADFEQQSSDPRKALLRGARPNSAGARTGMPAPGNGLFPVEFENIAAQALAADQDAAASIAREQAVRRFGNRGVNGLGYIPEPNDRELLARMIFAESAGIPGDFDGIGWSIVNRLNRAGYASRLKDVLYQDDPFEPVPPGNAAGVERPLWMASANPQNLTGANRAAYVRALQAADGILSGRIADPTGGGTHFFASTSYDGSPQTAPDWFGDALRSGRLRPVGYRTTASGRERQYFFRDTSAPRRIKPRP